MTHVMDVGIIVLENKIVFRFLAVG